MSEAPLHRLPPLNPMSDAPRDGTRIYAMTRHGEIKPFRLATSPWNNAQKWNDLTGKEPYGLNDDDLLGFWPPPEVREPSNG